MAAVVVLVVSMMMMMVMMILEKEGAVMQEVGSLPLSLSLPSSHDCYRFAYNSALQNDLNKKCHPSRVERWKTSKYLIFNGGRKKKVYPAKQQAAPNLIR